MAEIKRSNKVIEADVKLIQRAAESAKSINEISEQTGITVQKIRTSLKRHPIIKGRVLASLEANRGSKKADHKPTKQAPKPKAPANQEGIPNEAEDFKHITICDAPAMLYGLRSCLATPVIIPSFVYDTFVGLSKHDDPAISKKAENTLTMIHSLGDWCTIANKVQDETLLVDPTTEDPGWRAKAFVALCCEYWSKGYYVVIKTRTTTIANLARLQGCFVIDFVSADDEVPSLKVVG